jgi:hypothetical protein
LVASDPPVAASKSALVGGKSAIVANDPAFVGDKSSFVANDPAFVGDKSSIAANDRAFVGDKSSFVANDPAFIRDKSSFVANDPALVANDPTCPPTNRLSRPARTGCPGWRPSSGATRLGLTPKNREGAKPLEVSAVPSLSWHDGKRCVPRECGLKCVV